MFLASLNLKNFRLHKDVFFEFSPKLNLFLGKNACGKTTILEAINLLITGRSFRTRLLRDIISHGENYFVVEAVFKKCNIEQTLRFAFDGSEKIITYNNTKCRNSSALLGLLQGTLLLPSDIFIIKGSPGLRRTFLDIQLAQIDPMYVRGLTRYHLAMRQRNHMLKTKKIGAIELFESEMAKTGAYIIGRRLEAVENLGETSSKVLSKLSNGQEKLFLNYKASLQKEEIFFEQYAINQYKLHRPKEMQFGYSMIGPHKDDLLISIGEREAKRYSSEGQQKSVAASLKFAEWERINNLSDHAPLMLIDDIGASLDDDRRENIIKETLSFKQVFITSTDEMKINCDKIFTLKSFDQKG